MSQGEISLDRLIKLANLLNMNVSEIFGIAEKATSYKVLDEKQDKLLAAQPMCHYLFIRLNVGDSIEDFAEGTGLTLKEVWKLAFTLDRVGLIQILENNRIRVFNKGPFYSREDGLIIKNFFPKFIESIYTHFCSTSRMRTPKDMVLDYFARPFELYMLPKTYEEYLREANQLHVKYCDISKNEVNTLPFKSLVVTSGFLVVGKFDGWRQALLGTQGKVK